MSTTVAEMTSQDLKSLIFTTVQDALSQTIDGLDWLAKWRELVKHQCHLASLYAEFADQDLALAETGMGDYANLLAREDSVR
ncbi:MAG: hypothetical protein ISS49_13085 [Anaerolineae bacterium]|nr:hypothetical protein [Anaerolineae bacterium]